MDLLGPRWERQDKYFSLPLGSCLGGLPCTWWSAINNKVLFGSKLPVKRHQEACLKDSNKRKTKGKKKIDREIYNNFKMKAYSFFL